MKRLVKMAIIASGTLVLFVVAVQIIFPNLWAYYLPFLRERSAIDVSESFAKALRLNDSIAYELADPDLWPRIDQWMETHQVQNCIKVPDEQFTGGIGVNGNHTELFYCFVAEGEYEFDVYDVQIEETDGTYRVIDWGKVVEGISSQ